MRFAFLLLALPLASGCVAAADPDDAATDEDAITVSEHVARVRRCASALPASPSEAERDAAAEREANCVVRADDATLSQIERKLRTAASPWRGKARSTFAAQRAAFAALCASVDKGGTTATATKAQCIRDGEKLVASLIDAHVDLGGAATPIPEAGARAKHASCYGRFDAQVGRGARDAAAELAHCVERDVTTQGEILAWRSAPPGADPDRNQDRVNAEVAAVNRRNGELCSVVTDSGRGTRDACLAEAGHAFWSILEAAQTNVIDDL